MFHETRGKNVKFENKKSTATWVPSETGGHLFSAQPIRPDQNLVLRLDGSGGVELGIVGSDPAQLVRGLASCRERDGLYQFLNDVKIHKRSCEMTVEINYEKREVTSKYGSGVYTQKLKTNKRYWLVADVKYGEVEIRIQNEDAAPTMYSFSTRTGKNIEVQHSDSTIARSLEKSPASLCIYGSPVKPGQTLLLKTAPREHQGTIPGRYYVRLFITNLTPEELRRRHPDRFDVSLPKTGPPNWTTIEKFVKDDCRGIIRLEFHDTFLKYRSANNKTTSQDYKNLQPDRHEMWLVLELYGVSVGLEDGTRRSNRSADDLGSDEIDATRMPIHDHHGHIGLINSDISNNLEPIIEQEDNVTPGAERGQGTSYADNQQQQQQACANVGNTEKDQISLEKGIRKHFTDLLRSLIIPDMLDILYQRNYVTMAQMEDLHRSIDARRLLVFMSKKPIQRGVLREALDKSQQLFLLEKFLDEEEKR